VGRFAHAVEIKAVEKKIVEINATVKIAVSVIERTIAGIVFV